MGGRQQRRKTARSSFERSGIRRAIVVVVAIKLAAVVLIFDRAGLDPFDLPKSIASRAFEWVLAGLIVSALIRYRTAIVPRTWLHVFVAAFVLANVISAAFAVDTYVALFGERDRYLGLTFVGDMLVLYLSVAVAFRGTRDWTIVLAAVGLAGAASLAYAAVQYAGLDPIAWESDPHQRPFGTFGNPDMLGHFLSFAFAVALGIGVAAGPRDRSTRIAAMVAGIVVLAGMGMIATRGSALGVVAALAALPLVAFRLRPIARAADLVRVLGIAAVLMVGMASVILVSPLGTRLLATVQGIAIADRVAIYENALSAFKDRPLVGWGPDGFAVAYPHYRQEAEIGLVGINKLNTSAHDWLLQAAATTGVLGLGTLLALIVATTAALWRSALVRQPAVTAPLLLGWAAYWAHGLVSVGSIDLEWFPWIVVGSAAAITGRWIPEEAATGPRRRARHAVAYAAAAAGLLLAYPAFTANQNALAASLSLERGNVEVASRQAEAAVASDSGRARYWSVLGAVRQRAGLWRAAADAHSESTRRAPYIASYWVNLASARAGQAVTGDDRPNARAAAFAAARQAIAVDPYEPVPHVTLGRVAAEFGDQELAYAEVARAITLYQHNDDFDRVAAAIAAQSKDPKPALVFLEGLLAYKDSAILRMGIAQTALRMGDRDAARDNARRALQLEPANADARALLASLGG